MAGVNKVILLGNLGKDPEVRRLDDGFVNFSLATSETYKNKSGEKVTTRSGTILFYGLHLQILLKTI